MPRKTKKVQEVEQSHCPFSVGDHLIRVDRNQGSRKALVVDVLPTGRMNVKYDDTGSLGKSCDPVNFRKISTPAVRSIFEEAPPAPYDGWRVQASPNRNNRRLSFF